jgi:hypothetical protein
MLDTDTICKLLNESVSQHVQKQLDEQNSAATGFHLIIHFMTYSLLFVSPVLFLNRPYKLHSESLLFRRNK